MNLMLLLKKLTSFYSGTVQQVQREHMAFTDSDSSEEDLVIILVTKPFHGRFVIDKSGQSGGTLDTVISFTQADVNEGRVR